MKHLKFIISTLSFVLSISACALQNVSEETRLDKVKSIDNFSWLYQTEFNYEQEVDCNDVPYLATQNYTYYGYGYVTSTNASTNEYVIETWTYPMDYMRALADYYEFPSVEQYIEESMLFVDALYEIKNDTLIVQYKPAAYVKCFIILDEETNEYYSSTFRCYADGGIDVRQEPTLMSEDEVASSIKNFVALNQPLFEEVINENNKEGSNIYKVNNPTSLFYYADSKTNMNAHQIDSMILTFKGENLTEIDYVNNGRLIEVKIFDIGKTSIEEYPDLSTL